MACGTGKSPQQSSVPPARFGYVGLLEAVATASAADARADGMGVPSVVGERYSDIQACRLSL